MYKYIYRSTTHIRQLRGCSALEHSNDSLIERRFRVKYVQVEI